jgi:hypothetical protein
VEKVSSRYSRTLSPNLVFRYPKTNGRFSCTTRGLLRQHHPITFPHNRYQDTGSERSPRSRRLKKAHHQTVFATYSFSFTASMFEIGPLTSFTPPAHCSTPLLKCTSGLGCAPTAGLTCGPGGIPTSAAECYPGGSAFMTQSYARYMPGEACPGNYAPATTTTYTTSTVTVSPTYGFTYFRATDVVCCPLCVPPRQTSRCWGY